MTKLLRVPCPRRVRHGSVVVGILLAVLMARVYAQPTDQQNANVRRTATAGRWSVTWSPGVAVARPAGGGDDLTIFKDMKLNEEGEADIPAGSDRWSR